MVLLWLPVLSTVIPSLLLAWPWFDVPTSLPSSLWVGHLHSGGYSSRPFGCKRCYDSVSPLFMGGLCSDDLEVKEKFQWILKELINVDFMCTVKWFLGTHFQWMITPDSVQVHLSQTGFAANLVKENNRYNWSITHDKTPYCLDLPIDAIPESNETKSVQHLLTENKNIRVLLVRLVG